MTDHSLYYLKPYEKSFTARAVHSEKSGGLWQLELDRTLFYPEGGGQPSDRGSLNGIPVRDVQKKDGRVIHYMDSLPEGEELSGELDWDNRYHFMIQHTGQHLISSALMETAGIGTLSVHLGEEYSTIEVDREDIPAGLLLEVEKKANERIRENGAIRHRILEDRTELENIPLRRPTSLEKNIRLTVIGDYDYAACAGIHVRRTGELGLIKYTGTEKIRGRSRLYWKIGSPAYRDYEIKHQAVLRANSLLSSRTEEMTERLEQLLADRNGLAEQLRKLEVRSAEQLAGTLAESITSYPPVILKELPADSPGLFRQTVRKLSENRDVSFLLTMKDAGRLHWALHMPHDEEFRFDRFRETCLSLIEGKGGGRGPLWQGSGSLPGESEHFVSAFRELTGI